MARILAVDDDESLANNVKTYLQLESHQVDLLFNGSAGLAKMQGSQYDLIILDWQMPGRQVRTSAAHFARRAAQRLS